MRQTIIARPHPFDGPPVWHLPEEYGVSPGRPLLWRLPATGQRPLHFSAVLPEGLTLNEGIVTGTVDVPGSYQMTLTVENELGSATAAVTLLVEEDAVCRTPLTGWCSWNACLFNVTQEKVENAAALLESTGLADYGYAYVNLDSVWQGEYGGPMDAIMPNDNFPDMAGLCARLHARGLKAGIYSTPFLNAFGLAECQWGLPGCTRGEPDPRYSLNMGGIGQLHCENNNAAQWAEWGFDYLKYDWTPCDPENADRMKQALRATGRDFAFCVTVHALPEYADYWRKNCSSWRNNPDSADQWDVLRRIFASGRFWFDKMSPGHFYDMDMLEIGTLHDHVCRFTEDEQLVAVSLRAFFNSPVQISCDLAALTPFELSLLTNEEVLAIHRSIYSPGARCIIQETERDELMTAALYEKPLSPSTTALGYFNLGDSPRQLTYRLETPGEVRDCWAAADLGRAEGELTLTLPPHTARLLTVTR